MSSPLIDFPADLLVGPVKRSVTIAGHQSSISLEPIFWQALESTAREFDMPLSAIVAEIDALRIDVAQAPNLSSAIRNWLFSRCWMTNEPEDGSDTTPTALSAD